MGCRTSPMKQGTRQGIFIRKLHRHPALSSLPGHRTAEMQHEVGREVDVAPVAQHEEHCNEVGMESDDLSNSARSYP